MSQISNRVEEIFSHAVALDQSGRLRNTIYCLDDQIFVLNSDQTVLLKFQLRKTETAFGEPVSFRANDYDSRAFHVDDGKIVFVQESDGFTRKKSCVTPGDTPEEIAELFAKYEPGAENSVKLSRDVIGLLDESLSHIEISGEDGDLVLVQRNIYSGTVSEIRRSEEDGLGAVSEDSIKSDFGPLGMRTNDFIALFSYIDRIRFEFPSADQQADYAYMRSLDPKMPMEGIVALCLYDELGSVEESKKGAKDNGRKKPQNRRRQQKSDNTADTGRKRTRTRK